MKTWWPAGKGHNTSRGPCACKDAVARSARQLGRGPWSTCRGSRGKGPGVPGTAIRSDPLGGATGAVSTDTQCDCSDVSGRCPCIGSRVGRGAGPCAPELRGPMAGVRGEQEWEVPPPAQGVLGALALEAGEGRDQDKLSSTPGHGGKASSLKPRGWMQGSVWGGCAALWISRINQNVQETRWVCPVHAKFPVARTVLGT